jgi:hypothetical protein
VALIPTTTGYIAPGSNSVGIHGSWFIYSDCTGAGCATVTSPTGAGAFPNVGGKICTSGMTGTAANYAGGAGVGMELNDGPPQMPYDAVTYGVKGFCFQLSGTTIPTINVAFTTQNNVDYNAWYEPVSGAGTHQVLFTDPGFTQGTETPKQATFESTAVMLVQFQIPASLTAPVPWNFCIDGMTAVTQ